MTQVFEEGGKVVPATSLSVMPLTVIELKTSERDGYNAVQVGAGNKKEKRISKPQKGHFKNLGNFAVVREFGAESKEALNFDIGSKIDASGFAQGDKIEVSAVTKGKGFQGVVKRHGFHGGPRSHGQKHSEREPGSIGGAGREGGRVAKGKRMAGRMGGNKVTVKNLRVLYVDPEKNEMLVSGAVPGRRGTLVEVRSN